MRRGGRGPLHLPIRGGERDNRRPDGEEEVIRDRRRAKPDGSTTIRSDAGETLHRDTATQPSPELDEEPRSQNLDEGEGKPASTQNSWINSSSERRGRWGTGELGSSSASTASSATCTATWAPSSPSRPEGSAEMPPRQETREPDHPGCHGGGASVPAALTTSRR